MRTIPTALRAPGSRQIFSDQIDNYNGKAHTSYRQHNPILLQSWLILRTLEIIARIDTGCHIDDMTLTKLSDTGHQDQALKGCTPI